MPCNKCGTFLYKGGIKMKKCVAYLRVSTEKQAEEGNGLESQRRDVEIYCQKNEMIISDWYIDDGYTGANMDRPELQRLINDCVRKRIKCIVAFKLDRLSRSMVDGIYLIERVFQPNKVDFKCVHDSISYDSPMEQAYTQMMAVFAQLDKNTMMLRMRGGMLERVKKGYWMGGGNTPYCYRYDKESGVLVPIEDRKQQSIRALELFISGYSDERIKEICGYKNEAVVRNILTGVVNIGMIPYKGKIYKGLHEPIFDKERFDLAQKIREDRRKKKTTCHTEANILTGLCFCGICGCKMRYQKWSGGKHKICCCSRDKHLSYLPNHKTGCNNSSEWSDDIEKKVESKVLKISLDLSTKKHKKVDNVSDSMVSKIKKEKDRLKRLYKLYADGRDEVLDIIEEEEEKIKLMESNLKDDQKNKSAQKNGEIVFENIKKFADVWDDIDKKSKNLLLKIIIDKIIIVNGNVEIQLKNF